MTSPSDTLRLRLQDLHQVSLRLLEDLQLGDGPSVRRLMEERQRQIQDLARILEDGHRITEAERPAVMETLSKIQALGKQALMRGSRELRAIEERRRQNTVCLKGVQGYRPPVKAALSTLQHKA